METVEVVIRIPKQDYNVFKHGRMPNDAKEFTKYMVNAIAKGIPLPKGHGKLIDSNVIWDAFQDLGQDFQEAFDFAEANAVIEADEEDG